jgi:hypothetical protein
MYIILIPKANKNIIKKKTADKYCPWRKIQKFFKIQYFKKITYDDQVGYDDQEYKCVLTFKS